MIVTFWRSVLAGLVVLATMGFEPVTHSWLAAPSLASATQVTSAWQQAAPGIAYREFFLPTPNRVYVARMERGNPAVTLESAVSQGALGAGLETVRQMAARYDQAINYWGGNWGARNQVVVAINGFFYDPETGFPQGGQVHSGWYARRFDDLQSGSGLAWTLDGRIFIGGCVTHPPNRQIVTFLDSGESLSFAAINPLTNENTLVVYTPQFGAATPAAPGSLEVLVELSRPFLISPTPAMITGVVRDILQGEGGMALPFDHLVLSARGQAADALRQRVKIGTQLGFSQELRHFEADCRTPHSVNWEKIYSAIGASFIFLRDGVVQKFTVTAPLLRSPRTAVAYNDRYVYFIVVDGRAPLHSLGMSMVELAVFARTQLGATWGAALDGGGSSTMVVNGQLKNRPNTEVQDANLAGQPVERAVANGLMMVVSQPGQQSIRFTAGERVQFTANTTLRLGPGMNYAAFANTLFGQAAVVAAHDLNGVLATGSNWWKVSFEQVQGWVSEEWLVKAP